MHCEDDNSSDKFTGVTSMINASFWNLDPKWIALGVAPAASDRKRFPLPPTKGWLQSAVLAFGDVSAVTSPSPLSASATSGWEHAGWSLEFKTGIRAWRSVPSHPCQSNQISSVNSLPNQPNLVNSSALETRSRHSYRYILFFFPQCDLGNFAKGSKWLSSDDAMWSL